ncbi:LAQU0S06e03136g1_1 [Lachancea quebecensis]|uniref:LAQU0S06e03136g1_1 n=1 Tax=Lachancea quebecensis TaxID=1654605 RepID=A0A0N7MLM0_9SACH|nr:LAQU0S06e03136g1_1 [Lachancea quebecensis]
MASKSVHQNRLTQCFDDIMKTAAEMLVQQQIKSIQLSSDIAPGYTQKQYKSLGDKVHAFHSVLDDLDLTLSASKSCIDKLALEAQERKQEEEKQRIKEEEEARKKLSEMQKPGTSAATANFAESTPGAMLNEISKTGIAGADNGPRGSNNNAATGGSYANDFNELNDLDLSMFGGMEQNELGLADFGENTMGANTSGGKDNANEGGFNAAISPGNNDGMNGNQNTDVNSANPESYLTLNDFNDLGLDWNNTEGQGGLDMNEFNI